MRELRSNTAAGNQANKVKMPENQQLISQSEVARPISNLGNTCYMNAVLQALAHAPELLAAIDAKPHHVNCPIAEENRRMRRALSPSSSPDDRDRLSPTGSENDFRRKPRTLRRSSRKSPTNGMSANVNTAAAAAAAIGGVGGDGGGGQLLHHHQQQPHNNEGDQKYCALCEMEWHLQEVHSQSYKDKPVMPSCFVHGFIDNVAPWFKLGQQEDSHEFLRLFIDAMQKSCKKARPEDDDGVEDEDEDDNEYHAQDEQGKNDTSKDTEYPFQLFRGTVESCVTCDSCLATSSTMDPIEDVGLEVTPTHASPSGIVPTTETLADVKSAFRRFARKENLDAGYKCEKCGKGGRATKQSRLASIPPILTLHLKRFRYGADARAAIPAAAAGGTNRRAKSGSAKIEGHIKFEQFFDLKPYLTDELQKNKKNMFCRLFAVVVHAGKNSHSGHYIAYVRNIVKNEWWRMDDARITIASLEEVMSAEAYMLFYRVVDHPLALHLKNRVKEMHTEQQKLEAEARAEAAKAKAVAKETEKENLPLADDDKAVEAPSGAPVAAAAAALQNTDEIKSKSSSRTSPYNTRKRSLPDYTDGKRWAKGNTRLRSSQFSSIRSAEEYINENVQFQPEFFKLINEEGSKANAKADQCPIKYITGDDVVGGFSKYSLGLKKVVYRLATRYQEENNGESFFAAHTLESANESGTAKGNLMGKFVAVAVDPVDENLL